MDEYTAHQRLLMQLRDLYCGGNSAELARKIKKDPTYVNRLFYPVGKKGGKGIGLEIMAACNEAFALRPGYWDGADGNLEAQGLRFSARVTDFASVDNGKIGNIKRFENGAPAPNASGIPPHKFKPVWVVGRGVGGLMPESIWSDGDYPVGATEGYAEIASQDEHAFLTEVVGISMVPRYNPGEYALVEPGTDPDIEDDVLVRLKDGQTLLKRLLSRRGGYRLGSYNNADIHFYEPEQVTWIYYVAHPVPRRKIKQRAGTDTDFSW